MNLRNCLYETKKEAATRGGHPFAFRDAFTFGNVNFGSLSWCYFVWERRLRNSSTLPDGLGRADIFDLYCASFSLFGSTKMPLMDKVLLVCKARQIPVVYLW